MKGLAGKVALILGCNLPSSAFDGHNLLFSSLSAPPPVALKLSRGEAGLVSAASSDWIVFYRADDVRSLEVVGSAVVGQWTAAVASLAVRTVSVKVEDSHLAGLLTQLAPPGGKLQLIAASSLSPFFSDNLEKKKYFVKFNLI